MRGLYQERDVFDRRAVTARLTELVGSPGYSSKAYPRVLRVLKEALHRGRAEIRRGFDEEALPGSQVIRANAYLVDQLVRAVYDFALAYVFPAAYPTKGEQICVSATGGYGRGELAPHSDIDLMFLMPYRRYPRGEQLVEYLLYMLWDLGLKVGQSTRSVEESIRLACDDMTTRTSLLEARAFWGNTELFRLFKRRFAGEIVAVTGPEFVEAKLNERDQRHARMGDTRYVLEPNVKEGKGGLRDLQTLFWIAKYLYQVEAVADLVDQGLLTAKDAHRFAKAENFLWTVRCHLHYLADRAEERLTFDVQDLIGQRMGYADRIGSRGVERFMKHYYLVAKDVGNLTRILCAILEEQHKKRRSLFRVPSFLIGKKTIEGFRLDGGRLTVVGRETFLTDPVNLIRLFHEAQRHELDIHPQALRWVTQSLGLIDHTLRADAEANRLFMEILTSRKDPEKALRRLNEAGVFGRFIPDFGRVVAQMQYDMYHVYTVDEHTIRAIGILNRIEIGELKEDHPLASEAILEVESRRVLYLAMLLHDIAKGRGGDHSEVGARIALKLGPRLGLSDWETETVSWLVLHHLRMSDTASKRDIFDTKTVGDFVAAVQSPERLRLLLVLTVADIRAVGPGIWNRWKATLLRELYYRALEEMTGGVPTERRGEREQAAKDALRRRLADWDGKDIEEHLARGYPAYWLTLDTDTHVRHALAVRNAERGGRVPHIETRVDAEHHVTNIIIYTPDHPGLFARIAGAMAVAGAAIVDAKIVTLTSGMALDTFSIQDARGVAFEDRRRLSRLWQRIEDSLAGRLDPAHELDTIRRRALPSRTGVFEVPPRVFIDNRASADCTVIEVNGRDRLGFLFEVTLALAELGLQISSAHISTYGERVVDVFYVKNRFGLKVEHEEKLNAVRERVLEVVADPAATVAAAE